MELQQELAPLRERINNLDKELMSLFLQRMEVSQEIALVKQRYHAPILDSAREEFVIANALAQVEPDLRPLGEAFLRNLIFLSKERQKEIKSTSSR